jgi:hypothetical protein
MAARLGNQLFLICRLWKERKKGRKYGSVSTVSRTAALPHDLTSRLHTQLALGLVSVFISDVPYEEQTEESNTNKHRQQTSCAGVNTFRGYSRVRHVFC